MKRCLNCPLDIVVIPSGIFAVYGGCSECSEMRKPPKEMNRWNLIKAIVYGLALTAFFILQLGR
jgi:hypothetical protein